MGDLKTLSGIRDEEFVREILETVADGVYIVDRDRRIVWWNSGAERITGFARGEVVETYCHDNTLRHVSKEGLPLCGSDCPLTKSMESGHTLTDEAYLHHKTGHRVPVAIRAFPLRKADGSIAGAVEIFRDVSAAQDEAALDQLRRMALLDALTELGNRRYAELTLDQKLGELRRYGWPLGVLFLDVDHFKEVNDRYGHAAGDEALKMVARTLRHAARGSDLLARWGGEEFLALLPNSSDKDLQATAERFRTLVEVSALRFSSGFLQVTISVGATLARPEDTPGSVLQRADALMYRAKKEGRNRVSSDV